MTTLEHLPVAVIGAGPVGLAAAAQLSMRRMPFVLLEASDQVAACFRDTAHVRLFSPWRMNIDAAALRLLDAHGFTAPDPEALPTAGELRTVYLEPLARALAPHVRFDARVARITRRGFDKLKSAGREQAPFVLRIQSSEGERELLARAVIDATGTWSTPNWMGGSGLPALGEEAASAHIRYGMPDVLGRERARYANKRVLVVGAGHSAVGTLLALAELAREQPQTRIAWAVRAQGLERIFGGGDKDGLPERGKLGLGLRALIEGGRLELALGLRIEGVRQRGGTLEVVGTDAAGAPRSVSELDEIIVATGARPDLELARELRLQLDGWLESTAQLAPLIDPNVHSCGSVPPHGHRELTHPEPGYYAIGAKSYGRAPNFLLATGYEQARSVVAALAGDLAAADDVQLTLPETGVCSTDFADAGAASACCGPAPGGPDATAVAEGAKAACCGPAPGAQSASAAAAAAPVEGAKAACCGPAPGASPATTRSSCC